MDGTVVVLGHTDINYANQKNLNVVLHNISDDVEMCVNCSIIAAV